MPAVEKEKTKPVAEEAGAALAEAWAELDHEAERKNPEEYRKTEQIFLEWAGKLAALLREDKK